MSEYDFYQIDHVGVSEPDRDTATRTNKAVPIRRAADAKISIFGSNNVGARMSSNYSRTALDFESKDNLLDHNVLVEDPGMGSNVGGRGINVDHNPYLTGSTVKRVRDEQAFRMGMSDNRGVSVNEPGFDIMDTNVISKDMIVGKNWPTEGHRSFGGKYDFMHYTGGGIH
jgi:hypothetical protein